MNESKQLEAFFDETHLTLREKLRGALGVLFYIMRSMKSFENEEKARNLCRARTFAVPTVERRIKQRRCFLSAT